MSFDSKNVIAPTEIRPRFRLLTSMSVAESLEHIQSNVKSTPGIEAKFIMDHVDLTVSKMEKHYWSPVLHITFEEDEAFDNTLVRCLIGPNQAVWTLFMLGYIAIGVLTLFCGMYGLVQLQLDQGATLWLWSFPIAVLLGVALILAAKFGQRKGHDQMIFLIKFLYHCLEQKDMKHVN